MAGYLLDTNHLSDAIRKTSVVRDRLRDAHRRGHRFATCWPVLCELEAGVCQTARPEAYRRTLHGLLKEIRIWPIDWRSARLCPSAAWSPEKPRVSSGFLLWPSVL